MKEILISIQPKWVEKILNGEKTIEIRKTKPSCELPCKVYIYCTQSKPYLYRLDDDNNFELSNNLRPQEDCFVKDYNAQNGKVVAEFTLNKISTYDWDIDFLNTNQNMYYIKSVEADKTCLTYEEICNYGKGNILYGWHIENLKIYDKPKFLTEFGYYCNLVHNKHNNFCFREVCKHKKHCYKEFIQLIRTPQSWCYVEKVEG